jgi:hypothetical protein
MKTITVQKVGAEEVEQGKSEPPDVHTARDIFNIDARQDVFIVTAEEVTPRVSNPSDSFSH